MLLVYVPKCIVIQRINRIQFLLGIKLTWTQFDGSNGRVQSVSGAGAINPASATYTPHTTVGAFKLTSTSLGVQTLNWGGVNGAHHQPPPIFWFIYERH